MIVLLKNDKNLLPLDMTKLKSIAVIGPMPRMCTSADIVAIPATASVCSMASRPKSATK